MTTYQEFRAVKEELLKSNPLRLDCMNTQKALEAHIPSVTDTKADESAALDVLDKHFGNILSFARHFGLGIRQLIKDLANSPYLKSSTFLLPEDVYPVYFGLIGDRPIKTFPTLQSLDIRTALSASQTHSVLLLPVPLVPSGNDLFESDLWTLLDWLARSPTHLLIIDSAYAFTKMPSSYKTLLKQAQCVQLFSLAKTWLSPNLFGMAVAEQSLLDLLCLPKHSISNHWKNVVSAFPDLPATLQSTFDREWRSLSPSLTRIDSNWLPPKNGYFAKLQIPFHELLEKHNTLGVPASVFGSGRSDFTIITCLFEAQKTLAKRKSEAG